MPMSSGLICWPGTGRSAGGWLLLLGLLGLLPGLLVGLLLGLLVVVGLVLAWA